jgi:hypothetical protein
LINTILKRWLSNWEKEKKSHSSSPKSYNSVKRLLGKIIPLYPDIFLECFNNDLTKEQKYVLIDSALNTPHLRTDIDIKQEIKNDIQNIILYIKSSNTSRGYSDEAIKNMLDESLGLDPLITPYHKGSMKHMLANGTLRYISEEEINTVKRLNDFPCKAEFYDLGKASWIPLQRVTEYELNLIEAKSLF